MDAWYRTSGYNSECVDLLDEEAVLEWAQAKEGQKGNGGNAEELFLQSSVQQFVEWLRDQDDEDDSEDDDEDSS